MATTGYNPYRKDIKTDLTNLGLASPGDNAFFRKNLAKLSIFGRNYEEAAIKNAKGIHADEDLTIRDSNGTPYALFSRKAYALMKERQSVAALNTVYQHKLPLLREYAIKGDIREYVTKLTNEVIVLNKDKKFCEMKDLPPSSNEVVRKRTKEIFENIYVLSGFGDGTLAWDMCFDWLVEGFICREIIYDKKGKNIIGFQKLDPLSIIPMVDPETSLKLWVQFPGSVENQRVLLDSEIIYISYSGSSNFMETSYVEPLIRPYNELKTIERAKLLFNLINATMHKQFLIPTTGLSPTQAEQEIVSLIADYKDHIQFDDSTGLIHIDGSKDLPYSKEYWLPKGENSPEISIIEPGGHDLNESSMLIWFYNAFKRSTKFPFTRLDASNGGGNVYTNGADVTHDDYNFSKFVGRLRSVYKDIILKPVKIQLILEFPELEGNFKLYNDIDIIYYGNSEIEKAKELANLQAKSSIAASLRNDLTKKDSQGNDIPLLHHKFIMKHVMEFTEEQMEENDKYWKEDAANVSPTQTTETNTSTSAEPSGTDNASAEEEVTGGAEETAAPETTEETPEA